MLWFFASLGGRGGHPAVAARAKYPCRGSNAAGPINRATVPSTEGYPPSLRQSRASSVHASRTAQGVRGLRKATPSAERLCCQREAIHRVWRKARRQAFTRPGQRKVSGKVRQSSACCCNLQRQGYPSTVPLSRQREAIHRACKAGLGVRRPRIQVSAGYLGPWRRKAAVSADPKGHVLN